MTSAFIAQVAFVLGLPLALCVATARIKRDGLAGVIRRMAVNLNAAADTLEIAQAEFTERKREYLRNARLSPDRTALEVAGERG